MSRDFSELCKQNSSFRKPGTPELHWPLALYKKNSVLDFRLYNQTWGMKPGNKVCVCCIPVLEKNTLPSVSVALHVVQLYCQLSGNGQSKGETEEREEVTRDWRKLLIMELYGL
jgi:hypothetical protein